MELDIRNHYETLVRQAILDAELHFELNEDQLTDLACLALNQLPARYIRFQVDMTGYASADELEAMQQQVRGAIDTALSHLQLHPRVD
ncbi:late competence development ComFB family protein [Ferrimonas balearica]|uniref:late competence development ComFB family protein n=1 Tax=Ferrimonas balearica TaxID=44012 RepID=UPI001C9A168E|nr:late competence development ComFB family protein [Ferrimonas balearica]MBY5990835.1 late competence development ComFB family protein [Ferrimonas balearica]